MGIYKGHNNYCIIRDQQKNTEDLFGIGQLIFDTEIEVVKIITTPESSKVYLKLNEDIAILKYNKEKIEEGLSLISPRIHRSKNPPVSQTKYTTDGREFYINSAEIDHHLNNFSRLLNQARVVPYSKGGQNIGYKIKAIDKGSLYEKLGLKNNDIIQEINGEAIDSPEKAFKLLKMLRNEREIGLSILRKNTSVNLTYHIN